MKTITPFEALCKCLNQAGSQDKLGEALGCSQTAIWKMVQVRRMSVQFVLTAEAIYGVSRHDLRPDIYPRSAMVDQGSSGRFQGLDRYRHARAG